eukprot:COSAG03_NODE_3435_length_2018_cov_2.115164_2_plen_430_part_01
MCVCLSVNDADVQVAVTQAASRAAFPGSAASRTAEVFRRLQGASGWLQLASSACSGDETTAGSDQDWCPVELSRTLMDLVSPGSAVVSPEAEAAAVAVTAAQLSTSHLEIDAARSSPDSGRVRVYRCVARTTVRESAEVTSAKTGILAVGDEIEAIEEREVQLGGSTAVTTVRVRCHLGWVSKVGGVGARKAAQDRQLPVPAEERDQHGTPILEEIQPNALVASAGGAQGVAKGAEAAPGPHPGSGRKAAGGAVAAHAGLVLGGPYTTDTQVLFCPALRWEHGQAELKVRWLRRHRPETEGEAGADGSSSGGGWVPIASAHGWSYTPCATDADCELQAIVWTTGSAAARTSDAGVVPGAEDGCSDKAQSAQQSRLQRLNSSGDSSRASADCTGASQRVWPCSLSLSLCLSVSLSLSSLSLSLSLSFFLTH